MQSGWLHVFFIHIPILILALHTFKSELYSVPNTDVLHEFVEFSAVYWLTLVFVAHLVDFPECFVDLWSVSVWEPRHFVHNVLKKFVKRDGSSSVDIDLVEYNVGVLHRDRDDSTDRKDFVSHLQVVFLYDCFDYWYTSRYCGWDLMVRLWLWFL